MSKGKPDTVTRLLRQASVVLALVLALIPALTQAVVRDYYFRTLDSRQGLLQNTVTALFQDREGFVWVATQGALHRFDGYSFVTLETLVGQENVLPSFAQALAEDGQGVLYVGTLRDGLFAVDAERRRVTPIALTPAQGSPAAGQIDALLYQPGVGLWVARTDGIGLVPEDAGQYRRILAFEPVPITVATTGITRTVNAMALDGEGQVWIAAGHGIYRIAADQGRAERYSVEGARALLLDGAGTLWIGSPSGLRRKPAGSDLAEVVWPHSPRPADGSCCEVIALAQSADGTLWLSVNGGNLWHMDPDTRDAVPIPVNPWVQGMLTEVGLPRLMIDRSDLLWVGSHVRGVVTTPAAGTAFRAVFDMDPARDPLTGNVVRSLIEGDDGSLWLGTQGGLRRYEPLRDAFESFDAAFVPLTGAQPSGDYVLSRVDPAFDPLAGDRRWAGEAPVCFSDGLCWTAASWDEASGALTLEWRVEGDLQLPEMPLISNPPPPGVYAGLRLAVFAQLLDADGGFLAGDDGLWVDAQTLRAGDVFAQRHYLSAPGAAIVSFGLYDPMTGERLLTDDGRDHIDLELGIKN